MAIRIEERGGRMYGYGHNTVSARRIAHDEYFDLAWLAARTEVNKQMQKQSRQRKQRKRFDMPMFLITIAVFCMVVTVFVFCKISFAWSTIPLAVTFVFMSLSGLTADYYYREEEYEKSMRADFEVHERLRQDHADGSDLRPRNYAAGFQNIRSSD